MLKKTLLLLAFFPLCAIAQMPDWSNSDYRSLKYPAEKYFTGYAVRAIQNGEDISTTIHKVEDVARVEAVSSIKVHVENVTRDERFSKSIEDLKNYDETIIETFSTQTQLTTNLEITNLHVETCRNNDEVHGFAYVKRSDVIRQFDKSITSKLSKLEIQLDNIGEMVANGQKIEARTKLESLHKTFSNIEADQKILLAIDEDADLESVQMPELKTLMQRYNKMLAQLKNGLAIFIDCKADLFGKDYPTLKNSIQGELSKLGVSFVDLAEDADWAISINAKARKYNEQDWEDVTAYFVYVDAIISIQKMATSQTIYENKISVKGSHTLNYDEAVYSAYKDIIPQLGEIIKTQIQH